MARPDDSALPFSLLQYYATSPYECSYLPARTARSQVATPTHLINSEIYAALVRKGFRRSGLFTYRPHCDDCKACIPVRVPVREFESNRTQRRTWNRLHTLGVTARETALQFDPAHFELYTRYQTARHAGGGMDQDGEDQYGGFLLQSRVDTRLVEFRVGGVLRMLSVIDVLDDGLSSVYTFYDPDQPKLSLGTYNILWQIAQCAALGLPYLYLGYWIAESPKMAYKHNFQPLEMLQGGQWIRQSAPASGQNDRHGA